MLRDRVSAAEWDARVADCRALVARCTAGLGLEQDGGAFNRLAVEQHLSRPRRVAVPDEEQSWQIGRHH